MKKNFRARAIFFALILCMLLVCSITASGDIGTEPLFAVEELNDGLKITAYNGIDETTVMVPADIGGKPVLAIGSGTFWNNTGVEEIIIPDSVTAIDSNAFTGCASLRRVYGGGVTELGDYAFFGCNSLEELAVSENLIKVGAKIFDETLPLPMLSVPLSAGVDGWRRSYAVMLSAVPNIQRGKIGNTRVTPELLVLNAMLPHYIDTDVSNIDALWEAEPFSLSENGVKITCTGFAEYWNQIHETGLFEILAPAHRQKLERCVGAMLENLEEDTARLIQKKKRL